PSIDTGSHINAFLVTFVARTKVTRPAGRNPSIYHQHQPTTAITLQAETCGRRPSTPNRSHYPQAYQHTLLCRKTSAQSSTVATTNAMS
ncbi:hypothetical protein, partial [Cupriavidus sp. IDO]|uniref:hypothetical protein n=1 Tax=Cupriavidus sp. IDO TaxID=1539142 RepID=UPI001EE77A8D